jgi:hypothetical protein
MGKTISENKNGSAVTKTETWARASQKVKQNHRHHLDEGHTNEKNTKINMKKCIEANTKLNMNLHVEMKTPIKMKMNMNVKMTTKMNVKRNMNIIMKINMNENMND